MKKILTLYLEINEFNYIFFVGQSENHNSFTIDYKLEVPIEGIDINGIFDLEKASNTIKENIYKIEKKFNHTFKDIVLILDTLNLSFINLSGFKKLNGSQILRENVTYILNTLKSCVGENEERKKILHIFNSKFCLDDKIIENLPIGLFGDFYSHELSFSLIDLNDHKNLINIFDKCNLSIKKIIIKSFVKGVFISENYKNIENFFHIKFKKKNSKMFLFEKNSLKSEQKFKFGIDIIIQDISKIISLDFETVEKILSENKLNKSISEEELIEKKYFINTVHRKIKKRLIYEIAFARIQEISEKILFKNINYKNYDKIDKNIFIEIDHNLPLQCLKEIFESTFSFDSKINVSCTGSLPSDEMLKAANRLVHFGWKKEAIPISHYKKSLIAKFFDAIFG